jgi:hypothetical protein
MLPNIPITMLPLIQPYSALGCVSLLMPSKAQLSILHPPNTHCSSNTYLLLPNSIFPMAHSRLRVRLLSFNLSIPVLSFIIGSL